MPRTFERGPSGTVVVTLYPQEAAQLAVTARDVMAIVAEPPDGDVRDRLYPRAYLDPTEEAAQAEYDALVHDDLVRARGAALAVVRAGLDEAVGNDDGLVEIVLDPGGEMQWLTAVNDARLVIGTVLGVTDDADTEYAPDDPRFEYGVVYSWLTQLHFELVTLLLEEIGEAGTDDPGETNDDVNGDANGDTPGESGA